MRTIYLDLPYKTGSSDNAVSVSQYVGARELTITDVIITVASVSKNSLCVISFTLSASFFH